MSSKIPEKDSLATKADFDELKSELKIAVAELRSDMHRTIWAQSRQEQVARERDDHGMDHTKWRRIKSQAMRGSTQ